MKLKPNASVLLIVLVIAVVLPTVGSEFFVNFVLTRTLMLGIAASTIVFLSGYGGMTSMAQLLLFGVAGFMVGNASVSEAGSKGLKLGWNPWISVGFALAVCVVLAFLLGAISARTTGIYYLMLTFIFAVIGFSFFGSVTSLSGFGGITGIDPPSLFDGDPKRLYYLALVISVIVYGALKYISKTPFGLVLQGVRDDPIRMAALGYNVALHRTLAFTLAGFFAALAGIVNVWWNGQIDPTSISIGPTIDLLVIAVIGGITQLEGAWIGAFIFTSANLYLRELPFVDKIGITEARFNTVIGVLVLLIMVVSPDGVTGAFSRVREATRRSAGKQEQSGRPAALSDLETAG